MVCGYASHGSWGWGRVWGEYDEMLWAEWCRDTEEMQEISGG